MNEGLTVVEGHRGELISQLRHCFGKEEAAPKRSQATTVMLLGQAATQQERHNNVPAGRFQQHLIDVRLLAHGGQ